MLLLVATFDCIITMEQECDGDSFPPTASGYASTACGLIKYYVSQFE